MKALLHGIAWQFNDAEIAILSVMVCAALAALWKAIKATKNAQSALRTAIVSSERLHFDIGYKIGCHHADVGAPEDVEEAWGVLQAELKRGKDGNE